MLLQHYVWCKAVNAVQRMKKKTLQALQTELDRKCSFSLAAYLFV